MTFIPKSRGVIVSQYDEESIDSKHRVSKDFPFTVEDLINRGNDDFYDDSKNTGNVYAGLLYENSRVGVPVSLENCLKWSNDNNGIVATLPYLVAGLSIAKPDNYLRQKWHTALSEEYVGIDRKGNFAKGKPVIITFHGGGLLTPDRIRKAYYKGLTPKNTAKLTDEEFDNILEGKLPTDENVDLYTVEDVKKGKVKNPFGRYGVVNTDFYGAKTTTNGYQEKDVFLNNRIVIARAGTLEHLEKYFDNILTDDTVGHWHRFAEIDPRVSQGSVLFANYAINCLCDDYGLSNHASFVGVKPK